MPLSAANKFTYLPTYCDEGNLLCNTLGAPHAREHDVKFMLTIEGVGPPYTIRSNLLLKRQNDVFNIKQLNYCVFRCVL